MTIVEMKEKRMGLVTQMRGMLDRADTEKRSMTAEEDTQYRKIESDVDQLGRDIETEERKNRLSGFENPATPPLPGAEGRGLAGGETAEAMHAEKFRAFLGSGEFRDLSVGTGGGALAPQQFVGSVIAAIEKNTFMREKATVFQLKGVQSLGAPYESGAASNADWTSEVPETGTTGDSTLAFSKRELKPNTLVKLIKISKMLLKEAALPIDTIVAEKLAIKIAAAYENGMLNGSGSGQPLGLFTASANGVATSRDVSTGNSATAIAFDGLINAMGAVRPGYRKNASWIFHPDAISAIRKLKDSQNRYLWDPSLVVGSPDMILGRPYFESEFAPNTFTTGLYVGLFGDLSQYWIAEVAGIEIQRLVERYAEYNQVGFLGTMYADGAPVLGEAFARVKLA
jgi:HK97 family phage major capsid protein